MIWSRSPAGRCLCPRHEILHGIRARRYTEPVLGFGVGGAGMRGRKPEVLTIHSPDFSELERIAHSDSSPWYQVRRARIVLGIAAGQRREDLATQLECDESTIWRTCQRYRDRR